MGRVDLQHLRDQFGQILGILFGYFGIIPSKKQKLPLCDLFEEPVHVLRLERRLQGTHFVQHATETPNIRLGVIGQVFPDFRRGVVRRAGLS